jgi:oligoendopeptidase F
MTGCSTWRWAIAAAKITGVDITTDQPLKNTIAFLGETLDQIIEKKD